MWIGIGVASDFGNGIEGTVWGGVVAKHAIAPTYLFQRADRVRLGARTVRHLLAFNEKCVPMIVVRVCGENPVVSSRSRCRHLEKVRRYYTRQNQQSQTKYEG